MTNNGCPRGDCYTPYIQYAFPPLCPPCNSSFSTPCIPNDCPTIDPCSASKLPSPTIKVCNDKYSATCNPVTDANYSHPFRKFPKVNKPCPGTLSLDCLPSESECPPSCQTTKYPSVNNLFLKVDPCPKGQEESIISTCFMELKPICQLPARTLCPPPNVTVIKPCQLPRPCRQPGPVKVETCLIRNECPPGCPEPDASCIVKISSKQTTEGLTITEPIELFVQPVNPCLPSRTAEQLNKMCRFPSSSFKPKYCKSRPFPNLCSVCMEIPCHCPQIVCCTPLPCDTSRTSAICSPRPHLCRRCLPRQCSFKSSNCSYTRKSDSQSSVGCKKTCSKMPPCCLDLKKGSRYTMKHSPCTICHKTPCSSLSKSNSTANICSCKLCLSCSPCCQKPCSCQPSKTCFQCSACCGTCNNICCTQACSSPCKKSKYSRCCSTQCPSSSKTQKSISPPCCQRSSSPSYCPKPCCCPKTSTHCPPSCVCPKNVSPRPPKPKMHTCLTQCEPCSPCCSKKYIPPCKDSKNQCQSRPVPIHNSSSFSLFPFPSDTPCYRMPCCCPKSNEPQLPPRHRSPSPALKNASCSPTRKSSSVCSICRNIICCCPESCCTSSSEESFKSACLFPPREKFRKEPCCEECGEVSCCCTKCNICCKNRCECEPCGIHDETPCRCETSGINLSLPSCCYEPCKICGKIMCCCIPCVLSCTYSEDT